MIYQRGLGQQVMVFMSPRQAIVARQKHALMFLPGPLGSRKRAPRGPGAAGLPLVLAALRTWGGPFLRATPRLTL